MDTLSVMGLVEPLLRLPSILKLRKWLINCSSNDPPDLYIGIDAPEFNLNIEKALHKRHPNSALCKSKCVGLAAWAHKKY